MSEPSAVLIVILAFFICPALYEIIYILYQIKFKYRFENRSLKSVCARQECIILEYRERDRQNEIMQTAINAGVEFMDKPSIRRENIV